MLLPILLALVPADTVRGDEVPIVFRQRGRDVQATLRLTADPRIEVVPVEVTGGTLTAEEKTFREAWLGSRAAALSP